jgi:hypothetical protein
LRAWSQTDWKSVLQKCAHDAPIMLASTRTSLSQEKSYDIVENLLFRTGYGVGKMGIGKVHAPCPVVPFAHRLVRVMQRETSSRSTVCWA